jgi:hypothetical protein
MKIKLDEAREALREERRANKRLASLLAAVIAEMEAAQAQSDRLDNIAEGYSDALTQLIVPDGPRNALRLSNRCAQERSATSPARAAAAASWSRSWTSVDASASIFVLFAP